MPRIVSQLFISLDGVVDAPDQWHFPYYDAAMGAAVAADYDRASALLIGRLTYDSFAGAWPGREEAGEEDAAFAAQIGDLRKVVVTRGPAPTGWRAVEAAADLEAAATALREEPGDAIVLVPGSVSVVRRLLSAGLLDELHLLVHPVVVGHGARLFDEAGSLVPLRLVASTALPTGVLDLRYVPADAPREQTYDEAKHHLRTAEG